MKKLFSLFVFTIIGLGVVQAQWVDDLQGNDLPSLESVETNFAEDMREIVSGYERIAEIAQTLGARNYAKAIDDNMAAIDLAKDELLALSPNGEELPFELASEMIVPMLRQMAENYRIAHQDSAKVMFEIKKVRS